jgi:hypothetical protein
VQRLELTPSKGTRIALGFLVLIIALPVAILGKTIGLVIAAAVVAGYIWLCIAMGKRRLVLDERGVTAVGIRSTKQLAWDDVERYKFWSMDQQAVYVQGGQGGAIGAIVVVAVIAIVRAMRRNKKQHRRFTQGRLTLIGKNGTSIPIDARYRDALLALDRAFLEIHPRLRQRPLDFSPFKMTATELTHAKKGTIGLADIEHIAVGGGLVVIKKRDKRFGWASSHMMKTHNVLLFLEMAAEQGLVVKANADVFMPAPVIDKLRIASSRQAAMPAARVVSR